MSRLLAVDASSIFMRALSVLPEDKRTLDDLEYMTVSMIRKAVRHTRPDYMVVALDTTEECWRYKVHPQYKQGRTYSTFRPRQLTPMLRPRLEARRMALAYHPNMEADDLLAALAYRAQPDTEVVIYSKDSDLFSLAWRANCTLLWPEKGGELTTLDATAIEQRLGHPPTWLPSVRALTADTKDNLRALLAEIEPVPKGWRCPVTKPRAVEILKLYGGDVWAVINAALSREEDPVGITAKEQIYIARYADAIGAIHVIAGLHQLPASELGINKQNAAVGGVDLATPLPQEENDG